MPRNIPSPRRAGSRWRGACALLLALLCAFIATAAAAPSPLPPAPTRPGAAQGPTEVLYSVWLGDITGINSVEQTFTANMVLLLRWHDPALAHGGEGTKQYALDDIWHPRFLIANQAGEVERSLPEVADVSPDGTAVYRQRIIGSFSQALNLRAFPFDHDEFRVHVVILGYQPKDLRLRPDPMSVAAGMRNGVGLAEKLTIQDWRITSANTEVKPYRAGPGVEIAGFALGFTASRNAHHFVIKVIIPLILIVMMSWAVFWIEPNDANTQMAVAVTAMLTLIAYRFAVDSDVPKLPYLTRLDAFILMSSVLVFLSLIEVMAVTKFATQGRIELSRAIDRRCRWIFPAAFTLVTAYIFFH